MDLNTLLDPNILAKLQAGGYVLMLWLMIVEWPIITIIAAFLASLGIFDIYIVTILWWIGDILWDLLFYSIGRYGLHIFSKKVTVDTPQEETFISKLDQLIHKNLALAIIIIKFTPYAPPIGLAYIGKIRVSLRKYLTTSMLLCIPIPLLAAYIGFHIGYLNTLIQKYPLEKIWMYIVLFVIVLIATLIGVGYLRKQSKNIFWANPHLNPNESEKNDTFAVWASKKVR